MVSISAVVISIVNLTWILYDYDYVGVYELEHTTVDVYKRR